MKVHVHVGSLKFEIAACTGLLCKKYYYYSTPIFLHIFLPCKLKTNDNQLILMY